MHVKQEIEEHPDCGDRPMEMNAMHSSYQNAIQPSIHQGGTPSVRTLEYSGYDRNYDQRLVNPVGHYPLQQAYSPSQTSDELNRQEKLKKELNNYMLQHNIPSSQMLSHPLSNPIPTADPGRNEVPSADMSLLKIKRSNGKLAIPDILQTDGMNSLELAQTLNTHQRAKREFVPDEKKDEGYWTKRVKNNDSARRSRVKRKALEKIMETRLMDLQQENIELRHELNALKRRYGILEEEGRRTSPSASYYHSKPSSLHSSSSRSSSPPGKLSLSSKDDELEHQSSASDDSRSLDDSRSSYLRSASALSQSLDPSHRDRADSFGSCGSSSTAQSPNSNSPLYSHSLVRTDKSGALDLTSDFNSSRMNTTPTHTMSSRDFNNSPAISNASDTNSTPTSLESSSGGGGGQFNEEKMDTSNMRGFPLKCRWKLSSTAPSMKTSAGESSGSFPSA